MINFMRKVYVYNYISIWKCPKVKKISVSFKFSLSNATLKYKRRECVFKEQNTEILMNYAWWNKRKKYWESIWDIDETEVQE